MYAPYPENMMESIKKVEATRAQRMATEPRRLTAEEKDALLEKFHPDYNPDAFAEIKVGPNKGQKAPLELAEMLHSTSRLINEKIDLTKIDYDVDVLVIGGGGAGSSCAIEAHNAGADVMIVTKLRIGDANTMMAEGGIQAADKRERFSCTALSGLLRRRTFCCKTGTGKETGNGSSGCHQMAQ